ncbi:TerD family protein [Nocardioides acrostichi]|uniref:TerD family protein n=1 Tax=Nocardioides acrostichi TaxID=2784339 RepID=A0A930UYY6_9ACTN|nr:TerD family protein [Nocardioides acrostichi]MBF4162671.1 TerD family protein [Nocardioides acrostichi]
MAISLQKGGNISLTKEAGATGLANVTVGLGWEARTTTGAAFDLDASAIVCNAEGKAVDDKSFVFYGNLANGSGSVQHQGDERTGDTEGDDEQIKIAVTQLGAEVDKVVFSASIYDAEKNGQNFGQVRNAYIRVVNDADGTELTRYDLSEDASTETAMLFGELYRNGDDWKFRAVGAGYASGLAGIATDFGLNVG